MLLSELQFGSYLSYTPRGESPQARSSREWRDRLKFERLFGQPPEPTSRYIVRRLAAEIEGSPLADLLTPGSTLVPIPGHAPLQ